MNRFTACSLMGIVLLLGGACATSSMVPSASVTTMQPVWPQYFKVEWVAEPPGSGRIAGYLYNTHGIPATNVQILAQALDASGSVIAQRIAWIPGVVPPYNRTFFRIDHLPAASAYRLSVWNFQLREFHSS